MVNKLFIFFDNIYKMIKLQCCILISLVIGLGIFTIGPTLYATNKLINDELNGELNHIVKPYVKYFLEHFKVNIFYGLFYTVFIIFFAYWALEIQKLFIDSNIFYLSNLYFLFVLIVYLDMFFCFSLAAMYKLGFLECIKKSFFVMRHAPLVPIMLILWTVFISIIYSIIPGMLVVLGISLYLSGIFYIINLFLRENERAVNYEIKKIR